MSKIRQEEEERFQNYKLSGYTYFDTPDGQDLYKKLFFTTKIAFITGLITGTMKVTTKVPPPKTLRQKLFLVNRNIMPLVGIAGAYTYTAYYATVLRGKDDEFNHFLAGWAAGGVVSAFTRSPGNGFMCGIFFSLLGVGLKLMNLNNLQQLPPITKCHLSSYYMRKFDKSLLPDIKGNWTKEPSKE